MRLHDYANEIADIAAAYNKGRSVAVSMFLENVKQGTEVYKGAKGVDYAKLKPHFSDLAKTENAFTDAMHTHYNAFNNLRTAGKRKEAKELICNE